LRGNDEYDDLYFVHSLCVITDDKSHTLAVSEYGGCEFASVILSGNVMGCQFHPEKSGEVGLKIINNFVSDSEGVNNE
jgi:glutamine amidotransferase